MSVQYITISKTELAGFNLATFFQYLGHAAEFAKVAKVDPLLCVGLCGLFAQSKSKDIPMNLSSMIDGFSGMSLSDINIPTLKRDVMRSAILVMVSHPTSRELAFGKILFETEGREVPGYKMNPKDVAEFYNMFLAVAGPILPEYIRNTK